MESNSPILAPVIALVLWTCIMWFWMYLTRIPAIQQAEKDGVIDMDPAVYTTDDLKKLPRKTQWKADNYNHLLEQPVVFYAVALTLALIGSGDGINLMLAWAYVGLRVVHSIWQATVNVVIVRFAIFTLSNIPLIWLAVNAALDVF